MDIVSLAIYSILLIFFVSGIFYGVWHILSGLISLVLGVILASHYYEVVAFKILSLVKGNENLAKILGFILIFFAVRVVVSLFFLVVKKLFTIFSFIPFHGLISHLIGGLFSLVIGAFILGLILELLIKFPLSELWVDKIAASGIALFLINFSHILSPLVPKTFYQIKSVIS